MQTQLNGKIIKAHQHNGKFYSIIAQPAADVYSQPSMFKVRSEMQLGQIEQEVILDVTVSGYVREKSYMDKQTGIQKIFDEDNVYLDAKISLNAAKLKTA